MDQSTIPAPQPQTAKRIFELLIRYRRFQTYFPHVDNVYSHRSTQKYKRKPFVSHYWDCRLKGRPSGTAKSDDPNKKKRKRQARERDLCDVKIKITEFFPGARAAMINDSSMGGPAELDTVFEPGRVAAPREMSERPGADGGRYYTIQRVNGSGTGTDGGHKHTLEESDDIKKNSVQRHFLKEEKVKRKFQVSQRFPFFAHRPVLLQDALQVFHHEVCAQTEQGRRKDSLSMGIHWARYPDFAAKALEPPTFCDSRVCWISSRCAICGPLCRCALLAPRKIAVISCSDTPET